MRIVVIGATGNVGTSLLRTLAADDRVDDIVGVARRVPSAAPAKTAWRAADVAEEDLGPLLAGADAVVHLAWLIQPSRDERELERVNVGATRRVFEAAAAAGVRTLVHASSIGAYSPGPKDRGVDEAWPTGGIATSFYSRHKARAERMLDEVEAANPRMRVVRLRPGLIFKAEAASEIRRFFAGPLLPSPLVHPALLRVVPAMPRLRVQAVHCDDVAEAYRLVLLDERARGAYNVAADPVLDPDVLARELGAVKLPLDPRVVRAFTAATWKLRLQPTPPGWLDMGLGVPIMDTSRIRALGWTPAHTSVEALRELLDGLRHSTGGPTPTLDSRAGGPARIREFLTGVGRRNP